MSKPTPNELSPRRIGRIIFIALAAVLLLLLLLLSAVSFLLSTQTGSQWAISQAMQRLNSAGTPLVVEGVEGTIFRGLSFRSIRYADAGGSYTVEGLRTSWNPYSLLSGQLILSDIWISGLRVELFEGDSSAQAAFDPQSVQNPMPVGLSISGLRIERLEVVQQEQEYTVRSISLGAELDRESLSVSALQLTTEGLDLGGDISLRFTENRPIVAALDWSYSATINGRVEELAGRLGVSGDLSAVEVEHNLQAPQAIRSTGRIVTGLVEAEFGFDLNHSAASLVLPVEVPAPYVASNVVLGTSGNLEEVSLSLQADVQYDRFPEAVLNVQASYSGTSLTLHSYSLSADGNDVSGSAIVDWSDVLRIEGDYALALQSIESFVALPPSIDIAGLAGSGTLTLALPETGVEGRLTLQTQGGRVADFPLQARGTVLLNQGAIEIEGLEILTQNNRLSLSGTYAETLDVDWSVSIESLSEFLIDSRGVLEGSGSLMGDASAPNISGILAGSELAFQQFSVDDFTLAFQRVEDRVQGELAVNTLSFSDEARTETLSPLLLTVAGSESSHSIALNTKSRYGDFALTVAGSIGDLQSSFWTGSLESAALDTPLGSWTALTASEIRITDSGAELSETCWRQQETTLCAEFVQDVGSGISASGSLEGFPLSLFNLGQAFNAGAGPNLMQDELLLLPQLPEGATIDGRVDGRFSLALPSNSDLEFDFDIAARDAVLSVTPELLGTGEIPDEEALIQQYKLETLELSGASELGGWRLNAEAGILRENVDESEIDVRGSIRANVGIAANNDLSGRVEAELADLRWLQALVPEFSNIEGSLNGRANLAGNIAAPEATGAIALEGASVSIDALGIRLSNISANVSSDGPESVQLVGSMQSGDGALDFNGEILDPFVATTTFSAQVRGENFQLSSVPNLELIVSPNVILSVDATRIEVIGDLDVPTLNLTLEELPESAVDVSRDVVIVNYPADRPELARSIAATESTVFDKPLAGDIDITLGENVRLSGFGMNTRLEGNLNIQQTAAGSNRTYGELSIAEGSYEMYRQSLNITQGKFLFFGAYDNPGIDLRATREVDDYTVGVLMNGTLKNINSQLFSTPALADNDIIAVLVTGRPFSEVGAQDGDALLGAIASLGVDRSEGLTNQVRSKLGLDVLAVDNADDINNSVLTIGKYITPDIFIRYGIGLFDSQSKVAVDYTVTERIKLQAESGEYQSVDIIYSVER